MRLLVVEDETDLAELARIWERLDPQWAQEHEVG